MISETCAKPVILGACVFQYFPKSEKTIKHFRKEFDWLVLEYLLQKMILKIVLRKHCQDMFKICATLFIKNKRILERQTLEHII